MIIADENIDYRLINAIREIGIDVYSINESNGGVRDDEVIELSRNPPRIILTEDKDFREWVFAHHVRGISVVFLRYNFKETATMEIIVTKLLSERLSNLTGFFTNGNDSKNQDTTN